ncbi:MAG: PAS domain S-box protein [Candidatus Thorarchaeota archaeon]
MTLPDMNLKGITPEVSSLILETILDNMTDGLIVASPEGKITQANPALERMLNYQKGELIGKHISELHPPNELPKLGQIDQMRKDQLSKGIPFGSKYELAFIRKDGRIIDTLVGGAPLVGSDGEFLGTFGIVTDITQQKIQQRKLRESYELNEMILRTMGEGLWLVDENDRTIMVNRALENLLGYERGEMLGRPVYEFLPEDQHEVLRTINGQRKKATSFDNGHKFSSRYEIELLHKSGTKIYALVSGTAVLDRNESFKGTFGIITDITERKKLEETIRETRDYLQLLLDNSADAIAATKIDGSIIFSNKAMDNLIGLEGFPLEEKEALSLRELLADTNLFDMMVSEVGRASRFFRTELLRSDKKFVPVGISMGAVSDSWGNPDILVSVIRDLTEKERTAKELMLFREYVVDQVHASIFRIGEVGADLVQTDELPFVPHEVPEERDRFFLKIGTFFLTAIGMGQARATGLYELPVAEFADYRALVYAFTVQNPDNPDPREEGIDYCLLAVFFPQSLELVFSDRESLRQRFEQAFSDVKHVSDLGKDFLQRIKRRILVGK